MVGDDARVRGADSGVRGTGQLQRERHPRTGAVQCFRLRLRRSVPGYRFEQPLHDPRRVHTLGLSGEETFHIPDLSDLIQPRSEITVRAAGPDGSVKKFPVKVRIDTPVELDYYRNGGILQTVLRKLARS